MDTAYVDAVARYLRERDAAEAEIRSAHDAYRTETTALAEAAEAACERRDAAEAAEAEAAALAAEADVSAERLWRVLDGFVGRRIGPVPCGGPVDEADPDTVRARLARADRLLELARQGELPIEAPRHTEPVAAVLGAALGAAAVAFAAWILTAEAGDDTALRRAAAAATLFAGIAAGPVVLGAWLSWQYRVRPRPTQTVACVGATIVVTCALAGVFLRGM